MTMTRNRLRSIVLGGFVVLGGASWLLVPSLGQQADPTPGRFEFTVIESFDAKYLGDSPGHFGRGKIGKAQPNVALGDPVFHGEHVVGKVSGVSWDRVKENLEVEFDPEPFELDERGRPSVPNRVAIGENLWIPLGGSKHASE